MAEIQQHEHTQQSDINRIESQHHQTEEYDELNLEEYPISYVLCSSNFDDVVTLHPNVEHKLTRKQIRNQYFRFVTKKKRRKRKQQQKAAATKTYR